MASKTSFYNNSGVTNEQSNAIDASVSNAAASETAAANSATSASNSASSASASAATATASKDAAVVAKDAAVVAKNAAEAAAGGVSGALAISNNLSDLANASTARTNLGVAIGSNVQAYSSVLQSTTAAYTSALNTKLSGIEANATADQTKSDIDALGINATQVSGFTVGKSVPSNAVFTDTNTTYSVGDGGLTQNNFTNADQTKLNGIEASADVTDTANVVAALTAGTNITIAANGTIASTASGGGGGSSYTHPNHSGEVTSAGDGATVIASNVVDADNLKVTGNGSNTQFLRSDGDGTFTWATPVDTNTTYSVGDGGLTQKNFTTTLKTKLDGIATGATAYTNANAISAVTGSDLDMGGNKVLFSNVYSALSDLPSASSNHGMFAHVHATGKGYYAHGGNWIELANASDIVNYTVQDGQLSQNNFTDADHTKLDGIATSANNYTHPNHSGEVTSTADGATVIADNVVDEANLKVSNTPTNGYVLTAQSGNTGGLTWAAAASGGGGGGGDLYAAETTGSSDPTASGTLSIAIGSGTTVSGNQAVGIGRSSTVAGFRGAAFGGDNIASAEKSLALGFGASSTGTRGVAINGTVTGQDSISFGTNSYVQATSATAVGYNADISSAGSQGTALGYNAQVTASGATALTNSRASGADSFAAAIDNNSTTYGAKGANGISIGKQAKTATTSDGVSIGQLSSSGNKSIALGYGTASTGSQSVAIGNGSSTGVHFGSTAIGNGVTASTSNEVSIGSSSQDVRISETYTLPKVDGTASGQVLTTNGSGAVSWATPASGGGSPDLFADNDVSATAPSATGDNSVAIGPSSEANSADATAFGYRSEAKASKAVAIGEGRASGTSATAISIGTTSTAYGATGQNSVAIGYQAKATAYNAFGLGQNSSATGLRSLALGKSLAFGTDSFAAAIDNNSTSYGAIGANSIAIGASAKATSNWSTAIGFTTTATSTASTAIGAITKASQPYSIALGRSSHADRQGKLALSSEGMGGQGTSQTGIMVVLASTTDATPKPLTANNNTVTTVNQIVLPNNSCFGFTGTVIAREDSSATNDFAVWEIKGGAVRAASASTTALGTYNINKISESTGATNWSIALSADTTNGAVAITVTGEASHNIRWVATVNTTEVTY